MSGVYRKFFSQPIEKLEPSEIFVFGSNLAGVHGAGAARQAFEQFHAEFGVGIGRTGKCYALPTKDESIRTMPLERIKMFVGVFIQHAIYYPDKTFLVTPVGCGLAGYTAADIAPMFKNAPANCMFHDSWREYLETV